jgi:hypothetical protein
MKFLLKILGYGFVVYFVFAWCLLALLGFFYDCLCGSEDTHA